jgi:hypothetical protein
MEKSDITTLQNKVFEKMTKWTSNIWRQSRMEANLAVQKTAKRLNSLSAKEQLEIMREQTKQADRIINEYKKGRSNG